MEEITLGEMGMTVKQLYKITPYSLFNKIAGHNRKSREDWERTRIEIFMLLSPNFEKNSTITPQELLPMPWDGEINENIKVDAKEAYEARQKMWDAIDNKE